MSEFQTSVRRYLACGVEGEIAFQGPLRVQPGQIDPVNNIENAFVARFYTLNAKTGLFQAGGTIGADVVFGGIAISPKTFAAFGSRADGPLGPSLYIGNAPSAQFMSTGFVWVRARQGEEMSLKVGSPIYYSATTGEISLLESFGPAVPNAMVYREPLPMVDGDYMYCVQIDY